MQKYLNNSSVSLSLAVFLATDHYDHDDSTISATSLLKPVRQLVLSSRVPPEEGAVDLVNMVPSRMGTAIHDGIERAWKDNYKTAMAALGIPQKVIDRIRINPKPEELVEGDIPVYMEQRSYKQVGKHKISGKFDFVAEGRVEDFKSTSTYTATNNTNDSKYILQGSIYRWLNPEIITQDQMAIQFIFTDWSKMRAMQDPKYPQQRVQQRLLKLKSVEETDTFVRNKLMQIDMNWDLPEDKLPLCSDEDLWRSEPVFKYYKNPASTKRSTKNFDNKADAYVRLAEDGNVGVVVEQPGQVTACKYCAAFALCAQKDQLIANGDLVL